MTVGDRELTLSNLDKVLFPGSGFTKGQLIDYYANVAPVILPHIEDRPLTMKRYPDGVERKFFYEKHVPSHAPIGCAPSTCPRSRRREWWSTRWCATSRRWCGPQIWGRSSFTCLCGGWGGGGACPGPPDFIVFDLDPGRGRRWWSVAEVALISMRRDLARGLRDAGEDERVQGYPGVCPRREAGRRGRSPGRRRTRWPRPLERNTPNWSRRICGSRCVGARSSSIGARTIRPRPRSGPTRSGRRPCPTVSTPVTWERGPRLPASRAILQRLGVHHARCAGPGEGTWATSSRSRRFPRGRPPPSGQTRRRVWGT